MKIIIELALYFTNPHHIKHKDLEVSQSEVFSNPRKTESLPNLI